MGFLKDLTNFVNGLNDRLDEVNQRLDEHNFNIKKEQYLKDNPNNPNPTVEEVETYWIEFKNRLRNNKKRIDEILNQRI